MSSSYSDFMTTHRILLYQDDNFMLTQIAQDKISMNKAFLKAGL